MSFKNPFKSPFLSFKKLKKNLFFSIVVKLFFNISKEVKMSRVFNL